jgi:molecular chaperone DnaJ
MMGGGGRSQGGARARLRGADLRYNLEIKLEEAFQGKQHRIQFTTMVGCEECRCTGSADQRDSECTTCRGSGRLRAQQGFFTVERTCHACQGTGSMVRNPCRSCSGEGRVRKQKNLSVNIPEGVEEGTRIRLSGEGEVGIRGGEAGDLYIFISISPHNLFEREGHDIHCKVPLKMTSAALGGAIDVPTIEGGKANVKINSGTQTGDKFRLKGKGMSVMQSGGRRGDMYIHVIVETPVNLSKRQKELLQEFSEADTDNQPEAEGFFQKVKEFWTDLRE